MYGSYDDYFCDYYQSYFFDTSYGFIDMKTKHLLVENGFTYAQVSSNFCIFSCHHQHTQLSTFYTNTLAKTFYFSDNPGLWFEDLCQELVICAV